MLIIKRTFRWIIYAILAVIAFTLIVAAVIRFTIFPNINHYKDDIAATITKKTGLKTTVGNIVPGWDGLSPKVLIREIDIYDAENKSALHLENVNGTLSWLSIPMLHPHLSHLSVRNPKLTIQRTQDGSIYVAGIAMAGEGEPDFANWLLSQADININNASIIWQDDLRQAPALSLEKVDFNLRNPAWRKIFGQHLFSINALPSTGTKHPITLTGHFFGRDVSKIETWRGEVNLGARVIDLTVWKPWFDYPIDLQSGVGKVNVALSFSDKSINKLKADVRLNKISVKLDKSEELLNAKLLSGLLTWEESNKTTTFSGQHIKLIADNQFNIDNGSGFISRKIKNNEPWINAALKLDTFDLSYLSKLQKVISLPDTISQPLNAMNPQGKLSKLSISLQGDPQSPSSYKVESAFNALSINAYKNIPGFSNLIGEIEANEDNGTLQLASTNLILNLKDILRWPIPINTLDGKVSWSKNKDKIKIIANNIAVANDHIAGSLNASYDMNGIKGGYLDLSGKFDNGDAKFAPFYYPLIMGDETINWLDSSILAGKANDVQLTVKGSLDDFPYIDKQNNPDPSLGVFKVTARISDATLEYGSDWPKIEKIGLDMRFEGNSMELNADKGKIFDVNIMKAKAVIPELKTYGAMAQSLNIDAVGEGPVASGIKFINNSPVKEVTLGFTDDLKTAGKGKLNLSLKLPLDNIIDAKFKVDYLINNGTMYANKRLGLPEISNINGTLSFDDLGINARAINANILGGPAQFDLKTAANKTITINAKGNVTAKGIQQFDGNVLSSALDGNTNWSADIAIKKPFLNMNIRSNLKGLAINLPAPLGKQREQEALFSIDKQQTEAEHDAIKIAYQDIVSAIILRSEKNDELAFDSGDIAINTQAKKPTKPGLALRGEFNYLNADEWLALPTNSSNSSTDINLNSAEVSVQQLDIFGRSLNNLKVTSNPSNQNLSMTVTSKEVDGDIEWRSPSKTQETGAVVARLKKLHIPVSNEAADNSAENKEIKRLGKQYPALDIQADDFKLGKKAFGTFALNAYETEGDWVIQQLKISNPDGLLVAEGLWHNWTTNPNTNLQFSLTANDVGNTLKRFGQPDVIKGGVALISGQLRWPGSPHQFNKKGLNGEFRLGASKGQVVKAKPGVGRLFGLLTLQSLPRRLTLDFRDLFSEGFAFDKISANAKINDGIMHSDDFFMTGPATEIEIKGDIDLNKETQFLNVKVIPHISDSLSLAALAGGPIAGAAAFVAQKLLKDPLNKIAQSEYTITGTWDSPVEKNTEKEKQEIKPTNTPLNVQ
ncbi:MAG: YhdP family protein [Methylophilaceae bacterium]|nr:YhdP family protein [Methylophilaceae bacterium]